MQNHQEEIVLFYDDLETTIQTCKQQELVKMVMVMSDLRTKPKQSGKGNSQQNSRTPHGLGMRNDQWIDGWNGVKRRGWSSPKRCSTIIPEDFGHGNALNIYNDGKPDWLYYHQAKIYQLSPTSRISEGVDIGLTRGINYKHFSYAEL